MGNKQKSHFCLIWAKAPLGRREEQEGRKEEEGKEEEGEEEEGDQKVCFYYGINCLLDV